MANIARFEPFRELDDLFRGFFVRPMRFDLDTPDSPLSMKVDLMKGDDAYTVKAEMPGINKDDINVSIHGNEVTITGELKNEHEEKQGEQVIRCERQHGRISRSFTLPEDIDEDKAQASYANGVLELKLPTKSKPGGKRLTVS